MFETASQNTPVSTLCVVLTHLFSVWAYMEVRGQLVGTGSLHPARDSTGCKAWWQVLTVTYCHWPLLLFWLFWDMWSRLAYNQGSWGWSWAVDLLPASPRCWGYSELSHTQLASTLGSYKRFSSPTTQDNGCAGPALGVQGMHNVGCAREPDVLLTLNQTALRLTWGLSPLAE